MKMVTEQMKAQEIAHKDRAQRMYAESAASTGTISLAVESTLGRLEAAARSSDRKDRVADLQQQRREMSQFLINEKVVPDDAQKMLGRYREYAEQPPSPEARAKRWGDADRGGYAQLVRDSGSRMGADATLADAEAFFRRTAAASPGFARAVLECGAGADPILISIAAKYGKIAEPKT